MSEWKNQDFSQLTVLELRKVAKAMGVQLGAGFQGRYRRETRPRAQREIQRHPRCARGFHPHSKSDDKQDPRGKS